MTDLWCISLTHLQTGDGAVVAHEGVALGAHGLAEDARHPRLHRVGRRVEVLADVGHQPRGEVPQRPVVVHVGSRAELKRMDCRYMLIHFCSYGKC